MVSAIRVIDVEATTTGVVRGGVARSELSTFVPAACGEVWSFIRAAGLLNPGRNIALYWDAPGWVEAGVEVSEAFPGNDRVQCSQLPGGRVATTTHFGPYGGLSRTHDRIREWCAANGHRPTGICWEIYGHWDESWNADPSTIRTDVFHLLLMNAG